MLFYSWQLALVVWVCVRAAVPLAALLPAQALGGLRRGPPARSASCSRAISEPVVGAAVVRSYAVEDRTQARIDDAIDELQGGQHPRPGLHRRSRSRSAASRPAWPTPACIIVGVLLGFAGDITSGEVLAFAFLVTLFVGPGADGHPDPHRRAERHRRLAPGDRHPRDPGRPRRPRARRRRRCRAGPIDVALRRRRRSPTRAARRCCATSTSTIAAGTRVAIVGETGSGKSTFAKLLTRLMDPTDGRGRCSTASTSREIALDSLRRSVVLVPQEGFLFDDTIAANVRYGRLDATDDEILRQRRRARPGRLARRPAARPRHPGRPARRVAVGRGAAAGRAAPRPPRRPRPAGPRRGHQRGRPGSSRCGSAAPSSG